MKKKEKRPLGRIFQYFRKVLDLNNQILEEISNAERVLGGSYLFDSAFLAGFVTRVCETTREVIYNLNSLTSGRYMVLYDRLEQLRCTLEDIMSGGSGPLGEQLTVSYDELNRDLEDIAGAKNANLADIHNNFQIKIPRGFAITVKAYRLFLETNQIIPRIKELYDRNPDADTVKNEVKVIFKDAEVPGELASAVQSELERLFEDLDGIPALAVRSSAVGEDTERSFAGQFHTVLNVAPEDLFDAYKEVIMARFMPEVMHYLGPDVELDSHPVAAGVQEMIDAEVSGVAYTRDPIGGCSDCQVIAAVEGLGERLVSGSRSGDHFMLKRSFPFLPVSSTITSKPSDYVLPGGKRPLDRSTSNMRRGSSLLDIKQLQAISETAMLCEKAFGTPRDLEWAFDKDGDLVMLQNRRLGIQVPSRSCQKDIEKIVEDFPVILDGLGHTAQLGAAAGRVVHVDPDGDLDNVPVGAIVVSRYAHPKLSRVLRKAGAIITDIGSSTGHLATIAREYRVPAIFGTEKATSLLKEGMEVTVDANERKVYEGIIEDLVEVEAGQDWEYMEEPEIKTLRRILSYVAPLYMLDPGAPDFVPEKCRTIHDIIHFSHIKAVDSIIEQFSSVKNLKGERAVELKADLPIKIMIIDIGGGIEAGTDTRLVEVSQIRSRPMTALLKGLLRQEAWDKEPMPFGLGDLFSSMTRPVSMLTNPPEYEGQNLAIVGEDYMNLSLLLGYHFNVIDSFVSEEPDKNYIYFRFAGGFAEESKRKKRAELIRWILETLAFKTEVRKDVVIGKLKGLEDYNLMRVLQHIGELIAFTRQLDVRMADEEAVERFYSGFLDLCRECN